MSISSRILCVGVAAAAVSAALPAHADLKIAKAATKNVSCTGGACVATSRNAVMNVTDLATLLASQPSVSLDAGPARDITVKAGFSWTSGNSLALKASRALTVEKPVTVASKASVTIQSASMMFADKASLTFWDLGSSLTINGNAYTLVGDVAGLVQNAPWCQTCFVAMANDYDASNDQYYLGITYTEGVLEGLGHTISHLNMDCCGATTALIDSNEGTITNFKLTHAYLSNGSGGGLLVNTNGGVIDHVFVAGSLCGTGYVGGLVGINDGTITNSGAAVAIKAVAYTVGGLVGWNGGTIRSSYAAGKLKVGSGWGFGGLVGLNTSLVENSYSVTKVGLFGSNPRSNYGGLVGADAGQTISSYAAGKDERAKRSGGVAGGVVGCNCDDGTSTYENAYWDRDNGVHSVHQGAGNVPDQPGLTGLTDTQLKSGLPVGFDPMIWGQSPSINNGYPYLLANPPQ